MQTAFGYNMLALVEGQPQLLPLKRLLQEYLDYRLIVLTRRTQYELTRAQARAHVLEGLRIALDNLDAVIRTIRAAESAEVARGALIENFNLSEIQARAILDMQLRQLANLERQRILDELETVQAKIAYLEDLLANPEKILALVNEELTDLKKKFGDPRRTEIHTDFAGEITEEDLINNEQVLITISGRGYVKRMPATTYRAQRRGGRGIIGQVLREEDALRLMVAANTKDSILFFTDRGRVFQLKAWQVPQYDRQAKGIPLINVINIEPGEIVTAILAAPDMENGEVVIFATKLGEVKKARLSDFAKVRTNGLRAMNLEEGDELLDVKECRDDDDVILVTSRGQAARFRVGKLRLASRVSGGVKGVRLAASDQVVNMAVVRPGAQLLVITENGYGKRTPIDVYPTKGRNTGGVRTFKATPKTGPVAAARLVEGDEELMMISANGIVIRMAIETISERSGRATSGVTLMRVDEGDRVAAVAILRPSEPIEGLEGEEDDDAELEGEEILALPEGDADESAEDEGEESAEEDDEGVEDDGGEDEDLSDVPDDEEDV
jgi:DNA gyrase subunit A